MNAPEWKQALLGCLGAAGSGFVQSLHAYFLGTIISVYFEDKSTIKSKIRFYCFIFLSLGVISFIANLCQHYNFAIMGERLTKRVREKMLGKLLTFEIGWFDEDDNTSAAICARLATEANTVRSLIAERMSLLVQVSFSASLAFALGLLASWRVSIVMIAMQPLLIASFYSKSVLIKSMSAKIKKAQSEGSQLASEATINHRTITAFSSQERILGLFEAATKGPRKESIKASWFSGLGLFSSQFLTTAAIAVTFWYGGRLMNQKLVTPKNLFQAFVHLDIKGQIELKKMVFSYPARPEQTIFKGLSLKIEAGKTIALVGQRGSGKSTVIGLIERLYDPLEGSVLIYGSDIKSYNLRKLRSYIALVSQETTLFAGTIRENIAYSTEDATEYEVRKAEILANAHEFIRYVYIYLLLYCYKNKLHQVSFW